MGHPSLIPFSWTPREGALSAWWSNSKASNDVKTALLTDSSGCSHCIDLGKASVNSLSFAIIICVYHIQHCREPKTGTGIEQWGWVCKSSISFPFGSEVHGASTTNQMIFLHLTFPAQNGTVLNNFKPPFLHFWDNQHRNCLVREMRELITNK